ncbi:MAG: hypothetical protein ACHQ51_02255 [Elusimicrobiota bacterium]
MKRIILLVLTACALSACVAETVERRRPRKGPVKEVGFVEYGGGHVRYSAEGWNWAVASRRRLALKLMERNCGKELTPKIVDEYTRQDADATYSGQDINSSMSIGDEHFKIEHYVHLSYECRVPGAPEPVISTAAAHAPVQVIPAVASSTPTVTVEISSPTVSVVVPISTAPVSAPAPSTATAPSPELPK